jgi:hypothetical protein
VIEYSADALSWTWTCDMSKNLWVTIEQKRHNQVNELGIILTSYNEYEALLCCEFIEIRTLKIK